MADQPRNDPSQPAASPPSKPESALLPGGSDRDGNHNAPAIAAGGSRLSNSTAGDLVPPHPHPAAAARRRTIIWGIGAIIVIGLILYFGVPWVHELLTTVSTDDAYINGHVTFVAPRVAGQVTNVYVDDNDRVKIDDVLVQLDPLPFQVIVEAKQAALDVAKANVALAEDQVRGLIATARSNRYKLKHTIEEVDNQVASLRANVAALNTAKATLTRAEADFRRAIELQKTPGAITQQDFDQYRATYQIAEAQTQQALEQVFQIRVSLGLPQQPAKGEELGSVPDNLDQDFSTVRAALATLLESAAPLGIIPSSYNLTPKEVIEEFYKRDPKGDVDRIYAKLFSEAPQIKYAEAAVLQAQSDLDQAKLNLSYCKITATIDGVVTRRNVNPGNNVAIGQSLMAVRSLTDIWVDANFKETQLAPIRIGQPANLYIDMYGHRVPFKGRVQGFTMGTGSTLAILPPENATGNFVKVVQRLPVRIEILDYKPAEHPLFVGLSVEPQVLINEEPTGDSAGQYLRPFIETPTEKPLTFPGRLQGAGGTGAPPQQMTTPPAAAAPSDAGASVAPTTPAPAAPSTGAEKPTNATPPSDNPGKRLIP